MIKIPLPSSLPSFLEDHGVRYLNTETYKWQSQDVNLSPSQLHHWAQVQSSCVSGEFTEFS